MPITFTMRVTVPDEVVRQELDGQSVFLNIDSGCYFSLDEVGTAMWRALTTSDSIQAAYEVLLEEYEVDGERLRADLGALVEKLQEQGLVEVRGG